MTTGLFKKNLFTRTIIFIIAVSFMLASMPVRLYAEIFTSDTLRASATSGTPIQDAIKNDLQETSAKKDLSGRIIVSFSEIGKDDVAVVGGKCANLGEMLHIPGISVPDGIALTTKAYEIHIDKGIVDIGGQKMTLREYINKRLEGLDYNDTVELGKASRDIRSAMEKAKMPEEIERAIVVWYHKLGDNVFVAVRSSATAEDLPDASFAGQQETYLFKRGDQEVLDAVRYCWSSLFTPRAIFYRHENNIDHSVAYLSVAIQMMVDSATSGVGFGVDVNYGMPRITINAVNKLGEGAVSGTVTPDVHDYVYDVITEEPKFYKKTMGSKLKKSVYKENRSPTDREATEYVSTTEEERGRYALTDEQGLMVAKAVKAINEYYKRYMDVEWAFDAQGKLWITQARSETIWNEQEKKYPDTVVNIVSEVKEALIKIAKVLVKGRTGAPRAATGKVVVVIEPEEGTAEEKAMGLAEALNQVEKGDILVTKMTTPDMVPAMKRAAAVVTDEGGPNCHAAIVARELRIPCVVGTGNATQILKNGMVVTVDARRAAVYDGALEIVKSIKTVDITKLPITKTLIGIINSAPDLAMEIWQFSKYLAYYGYGLFRKEFVDTTEILVHPLAGLDYDKYNDPNFKDEAQRKRIKENVIDKYGARIKKIIEDAGYSSYAEFYKDTLAAALIKVASAQTKGQRIKYRTTDFKTNEYSLQVGALPYEPQERNPMMGYRGIYRMLNSDYRDAFELEIEAVKKARRVQTNIDVMFPVVRTPEELKEAVEFLAKHGLVRGKDFKIFMMAEIPANIFQAAEFYQYVDGMSIGSNDLTQFTLGIGRDNNKMAPFAQETDPAVKKGLEIVIKTAKKMGVFSGLCGQRPSNDPDFAAFLVQAGIDSISATPDVFDQVVNVVAQEEKKLEGKPLDLNIAGWEIPSEIGNPQRIVAAEAMASEIIKKMGIHPLAGIGKESYVVDEFYQELMAKIRSTPADKPVIYSTDDLDKTVYEKLRDGQKFEDFDENPQLGFCGLARVVDPAYQEFFRWQLLAVKKAINDSGRKNIGIKLNLVRTLDEVNKALAIMKQEGLIPGQDGFMVGMEIDFPSNVLLINEFIGLGINFLSENNERFLSYDMGTDPGSQYVQYSEGAKEIALRIPHKIWTNAAEKSGIPIVRFEGEAGITPSQLPAASEAVKLKETIQAADLTVYNSSPAGFDNVINALKAAKDTKGAAVIGANVIFENAGTITVIRKIKESGTDFAVAVWAEDQATVDKLKVMGVDEQVADIITAKGFKDVLSILEQRGIAADRVILFNSNLDLANIKEEFNVTDTALKSLFEGRGLKVTNIETPKAQEGNINAMPLIVARGVAAVLQHEKPIVEKFEDLSQNYGANGKISQEDLAKLNDLTSQIAEAPLVKTTEEVARAQVTYEETASKI